MLCKYFLISGLATTHYSTKIGRRLYLIHKQVEHGLGDPTSLKIGTVKKIPQRLGKKRAQLECHFFIIFFKKINFMFAYLIGKKRY